LTLAAWPTKAGPFGPNVVEHGPTQPSPLQSVEQPRGVHSNQSWQSPICSFVVARRLVRSSSPRFASTCRAYCPATAKDGWRSPRAMYGLPSAARPPLQSHCACFSSSSVARAKAASSACCASLKQARPGRSAAPSAVAARQAAPLLAAALLLVAAPPGLPAAISPGFSSSCLL